MTSPNETTDDTLYMRHPQLSGPPATTTQEAFDGVWKAKGWELVRSADTGDAADEAAAAEALRVQAGETAFTDTEPDAFGKELLVLAAGQRGLATGGTKADIHARLVEYEASGA